MQICECLVHSLAKQCVDLCGGIVYSILVEQLNTCSSVSANIRGDMSHSVCFRYLSGKVMLQIYIKKNEFCSQ